MKNCKDCKYFIKILAPNKDPNEGECHGTQPEAVPVGAVIRKVEIMDKNISPLHPGNRIEGYEVAIKSTWMFPRTRKEWPACKDFKENLKSVMN